MCSPSLPTPCWPARIVTAAATLRVAAAAERSSARAALWPLLHAALFAALRAQAPRVARVAQEDLEDMASQKSLELLVRAEDGAWDPHGRADHEVAGYLTGVARHALVDFARRRGREAPAPDDADAWAEVVGEGVTEPARPEDVVAAQQFARALRECSGSLAPRARSAWFRRVFLERPSREIAARLGVNTAHVDVIVQRARAALRECMRIKGHPDAEFRPGAFVQIWSALTADAAAGGLDEERG